MSIENKSRRKFIAASTRGIVSTGVVLTSAQYVSVLGANDRVRLGVIGTGNRGGDVMGWFQKEPNRCSDKVL